MHNKEWETLLLGTTNAVDKGQLTEMITFCTQYEVLKLTPLIILQAIFNRLNYFDRENVRRECENV